MTDFDNLNTDTIRGDADALAELAESDTGLLAHKVAIDTDAGTLYVRSEDGKVRLVTKDD